MPESPVMIQRIRRVLIARCAGDLDLAAHQQLADALGAVPDATVGAVVVDLSRVSFLECSCLNILLAAAVRSIHAGVGFGLYGASAVTCKMLRLLHVDHVLGLESDIGLAVERALEWTDRLLPQPELVLVDVHPCDRPRDVAGAMLGVRECHSDQRRVNMHP